MTGKEMCEYIADHWRKHHGTNVENAEQIWNYSQTGELYMVAVWYEEAREHEARLVAEASA